MADKLHFSLVSPEREVYAGDVDMVTAPGVEGDFGVLAGHAPFMTVLKLGEVVVQDGTEKRVFEIQGGFADVTPAGLTILAEHAVEYGPGVHDDGGRPH
jgi:F-type H+-transporting ATPase subunit epsilon